MPERVPQPGDRVRVTKNHESIERDLVGAEGVLQSEPDLSDPLPYDVELANGERWFVPVVEVSTPAGGAA